MYRMVEFREDGFLIQGYKVARIQKGKKLLKTNENYNFNGRPLFVMLGNGSIELELLPYNKPSFLKIEIQNLDYFLQNNEHLSTDYTEQMQIEQFNKIFKINELYNTPKLYTQEYNELEKALFDLQNSKIEKF